MNFLHLIELLTSWQILAFIMFLILIFTESGKSLIKSIKFGSFELTLRETKQDIAKQGKQIETQGKDLQNQREIIEKNVIFSMSEDVYQLLKGMREQAAKKDNGHFAFHRNEGFKRQIYFLINHGFINNLLIDDYSDKQNIIKDIELTPIGEEYLELRKRFSSHRAQ